LALIVTILCLASVASAFSAYRLAVRRRPNALSARGRRNRLVVEQLRSPRAATIFVMSADPTASASRAAAEAVDNDNDDATAKTLSPLRAAPSTPAQTVDLLELAAASVVSCVAASRKIRRLLDRKNARLKADGSFVTDADYLAQGAIVEAIRGVSQHVRIVGEESAEEMAAHVGRDEEEQEQEEAGGGAGAAGPSEPGSRKWLDQEILERTREELRIRLRRAEGGAEMSDPASDSASPAALPLSQIPAPAVAGTGAAGALASSAPPPSDPAAVVVDASRVSVIVDPLDGTKSYAHGDYDSVSILVGIVLDDADPCWGVIGKPFGYTGLPSIGDTGCVAIYGGSLVRGVYVAGRDDPVRPPPPRHGEDLSSASADNAGAGAPPDDGAEPNKRQRRLLPRAVISSSRSGGVVQEFCSYLGQKGLVDPEPLLISGAGEKSLRLILRNHNEALWFFPKGGTSRWDVAAPDALLRCLGGRMTDKRGNLFDYSASRDDAENTEGIVACSDAELHAECIRLFLEGDWSERE
jgi:3'-phosphoadenosine 5'-phosphosulfate (PAPS) 3'-phosphatase